MGPWAINCENNLSWTPANLTGFYRMGLAFVISGNIEYTHRPGVCYRYLTEIAVVLLFEALVLNPQILIRLHT